MASVKTLSKWQKRDCDRCGFTFYKHELVRDKGLLVDKACVDGPYQNDKVPWRFGGKQPAGAKTVTTITATLTRTEEFMLLVSSGGNVDISTIAGGEEAVGIQPNQRLTLEGTSDSDSVTIVASATIELWKDTSFTLKNGDILCLVYSAGVWTETSRSWYYTRNVGGHYG